MSMLNILVSCVSFPVYQMHIGQNFVATILKKTHLHYKLVSSGHQSKAIGMVECFRYVLTKGVASTSGRDTPASTIIRI